jgi:hypothetical protein
VDMMRSRVGHRVKAVWVARWSGDWCGSGIRAASPARPTIGAATGPWWASVGLCMVMAEQSGWADSNVMPGWARVGPCKNRKGGGERRGRLGRS